MRPSTVLRLVSGLLLAGWLTSTQAAPARNVPAAQVDLRSRAALLVRADTGQVLYAKNADQAQPIASITKLMTAMVVLDAGQPMNQVLTITDAERDRLRNTSSRLAVGTRLTRADLPRLALMSSENRAAAALLRNYPGGFTAGVAAMNRKAKAFGMTHTRCGEGTGLPSGNRSSPQDRVRMGRAAARYPTIRNYSTTAEYAVMVGRYRTQYRNTNPLVRNPQWNIDLTKTGYINEAGHCLVMQTTVGGKPVVMVLMDSWGSLTRVGDANRARRWLETSASALQVARQP
jgi:D-alanyl-D-alanine endopeptidase (penicillin-binding protein 7)